MARRIIGVDSPKIGVSEAPPQVALPDLAAAEGIWQDTAKTNQDAYQEQFRALAAQNQALAARAQAEQSKGDSLGEALGAVAGAIAQIGQIQYQGQQRRYEARARKSAAETAQANAASAQNLPDAWRDVEGVLGQTAEEIARHSEDEGYFVSAANIEQHLDKWRAVLTPDDFQKLSAHAYEALDAGRNRQLDNLTRIQRETQGAFLDGRENELKTPLMQLGNLMLQDPQNVESAYQQAMGIIVQATNELPANITPAGRITFYSKLLDYISRYTEGSYEAQAKWQQAYDQQAQWEQATAQILEQYPDDYIEQQRQLRIAQAQIFHTTTPEWTNDLDVMQQANQYLSIQNQLRKNAEPPPGSIEPYNNALTGNMIYQEMTGQGAISRLRYLPGGEVAYETAKNAYDQVNQNWTFVQRAQQEGVRLQGEMGSAYQDLLQFQQFAQQPNESEADWNRRLLTAQREGLITNATDAVRKYRQAYTKYQDYQNQYNTLQSQVTQAQDILRVYHFENGPAGFQEWWTQHNLEVMGGLASPDVAPSSPQVTQNFPGRSSRRSGSRPLASVGAGVYRNGTGLNLNGVKAPYDGTQTPPENVAITAVDDHGSHLRGNAVDFSVADGSNQTRVTTLAGGRVVEVNTGAREGDKTAGGGYGNYVIVETPDGRQWLYGHMRSVAAKVGDRIPQGGVIGVEGSTGSSSGPHVHVAVWDGPAWEADPVPVSDWLLGIDQEATVETASNGLGGFGLNGSPAPRNVTPIITAQFTAPPPEAMVLPTGAYYYQGNLYFPSQSAAIRGNLSAGDGSMPAPADHAVPRGRWGTLSNPLQPQRASSWRNDYTKPNEPGRNYGYDFLQSNSEFRTKLNNVATRLHVPTQWLADVIATVTGGSFASGRQGAGVGLLKFSENDAKAFGTTTGRLASMSPTQQLDYVYRYFAGTHDEYVGKYDSLEKLWMATWYNKEAAFKPPTDWLNNEAYAAGLTWLPKIGQHAGRRYQTVTDVLSPHSTHTSFHADCPICVSLYKADGRTSNGQLNLPEGGGGGMVANRNLTPAQAALLDTIAFAEGTSESGYFTNVGHTERTQGWQPFRSYEYRPGKRSDASGRYQFMSFTWNEYARGADINNPNDQDTIALRLITEKRGAGGIFSAKTMNEWLRYIYDLSPEWASLPKDESNAGAYPDQGGYTRGQQLWEYYNHRLAMYSRLRRDVVAHNR